MIRMFGREDCAYAELPATTQRNNDVKNNFTAIRFFLVLIEAVSRPLSNTLASGRNQLNPLPDEGLGLVPEEPELSDSSGRRSGPGAGRARVVCSSETYDLIPRVLMHSIAKTGRQSRRPTLRCAERPEAGLRRRVRCELSSAPQSQRPISPGRRLRTELKPPGKARIRAKHKIRAQQLMHCSFRLSGRRVFSDRKPGALPSGSE